MRKLILRIKNTQTGRELQEDYDADNLTAPSSLGRRRYKEKISAQTQDEAEAYGKAVVDWFNSTCRPGESTRELLAVELISDKESENGRHRD